MNVGQKEKLALTLQLLPIIFAELAAKSPNADIDADDVIDLLAIWLASIIDNDSYITKPKHRRLAIETIGERIKAQISQVAEYRQTYGQSLLSAIIDGTDRPAEAIS